MSRVILVVGPTCSGKTTFTNMLLNNDESRGVFCNVISTTTRAKRIGEVDGKDYHFIEHGTFEHGISKGDFIEHETINNHYYGSHTADWINILENGANIIKVIDVKAAKKLQENGYQGVFSPADVAVIYLDVTNEKMLEELNKRNTAPEEIQLRRHEKLMCDSYKNQADYVIKNFKTSLESTFAIFQTIIHELSKN